MKNQAIALTIGLVALGAGCDRDRATGEGAVDQEPAEVERAPGIAAEEREEVAGRDEALAGERQPGIQQERGEVLETESEDARELLNDAVETLREMKKEEGMKPLLQKSKGVFLVPDYGRAAVGVGVRGGEGILLAHDDGKWSDPVFYDIGGISVGAQLGGEGGQIAMVLMSDEALNSFKGDNTFSLNAGAKLTIVDYSGLSQASLGKDAGDVVFWSDTKGAFAGVTLSATDVSWDDEENKAFYGNSQATPERVLGGKISAKYNPLKQELSGM